MMEAMQGDATHGKGNHPAPPKGATSWQRGQIQPARQARKGGGASKCEGMMENNGPSPASLQMLMAFRLLNYRMYEGTVPEATVRKRRARNKTARLSRRANRKVGR